MAMTIAKLLVYADKLKHARWSCDHLGEPWKVTRFRIGRPEGLKDVVVLEFDVSLNGTLHTFKLGEHVLGGGDWLELDNECHDADHEAQLRFRPLPPSMKIIVKSSYDLDEKPGLEECVRFTTKVSWP